MEPVSLDAMRDRSRQLGIDVQFVSDLADQVFYAKYPDQQGKKLEEGQNDLRTEWTTLANDLLTKLESLSPATRGKLGSYQRADYDRWLAPGNGASLNGRELNVLVNNRFGELFPDQKGQTLNPKTFGQVWYAIAEEEMVKLKPQ
jgi:serine/threonine-protein kinase